MKTLLPLAVGVALLGLGDGPSRTGPPLAPDPAAPARAAAAADTTLPVRPGDRLVVQNFSGRILVGAGAGDELRLRGETGDRSDLRLVRRGSEISVEPPERRSGRREIEARLRVPEWMDVTVRGRDLEVEVEGTRGRVEVRNVEGDIRIVGTAGPVQARSVEGSITVRRARGDLTLRSQGDDVRVEDAVAEVVDAESGDGDVTLRGVDAGSVRAETLDGDAVFDGTLRPGGRYRVSVHDGDALILIPADADAEVTVSTFDGEFFSDFPVTVERFRAGGTFHFTLGGGSARLEIQVFDGEIRLGERPGRQ